MDYIAIITLIIGAILGFGVEKLADELRFRRIRKYFFYILYELTISVENQIKHYKTYIESIDKESNHFRMLQTDVGYSLGKINTIAKEDLYKIFITRHRRTDRKLYFKRFTVLTNGFNLIQHHNSIDDLQDSKLREVNNKSLYQFSESLKKVNKDIDIYFTEYTNKNESHYLKFKENVEKLRDSVFSKPIDAEYSIYQHTKEYVKPLLEIVRVSRNVKTMHDISAIIHTFEELNSNRKLAVVKLTDDVEILEKMHLDYLNTLFMYRKYLHRDAKLRE